MIFARALAAPILAACILGTGAASAQIYPSRPITLVVPYPPRGANRCDRAHRAGQHVAIARRADRHRKHRRRRRMIAPLAPPAPRPTAIRCCCIKLRWRQA